MKQTEARAPGSVASNEIVVQNRQATRKISLRLLRSIVFHLLQDLLHLDFEIGIMLVDPRKISRINERYLKHAGSTDVITFDYSDSPAAHSMPPGHLPHRGAQAGSAASEMAASFGASGRLLADIYVCIDEAVIQSKRFRTSWQEELVRYVVHGILHLLGYDDSNARVRKSMKRVEDKLVADLAAGFPVQSLARRVHRRARHG